MTYKIDYEIILKEVEPFSIVSTKIVDFLHDLVKDDLISGFEWKIKE